jgi:hypothetical protein
VDKKIRFDNNYQFLNSIGPESFGNWVEKCGGTYLFGNKPVKKISQLKQRL